MSHICRARPPRGPSSVPAVLGDADAVAARLEDAAHYPGGHAPGVCLPRSEAEIAHAIAAAPRVLPVGAQSSLTGGATPFGDLVIATTRLDRILSVDASHITVEAGVTMERIQAALRPHGAALPPSPTFEGATAGGCVATNAAGAATFKYGSTRDWVEAITVVLPCGEVLDLERASCRASARGSRIQTGGGALDVPVPSYRMPDVAKRSAGYYAAPGMDLVDLFVGSEGTLGVVTEIRWRALASAPSAVLALIACPAEPAGITLAGALRTASMATWASGDPAGIDASAIEHADGRSLALLRQHGDLARVGVALPEDTALALLVQLEVRAGTTAAAVYGQIDASLQPAAPDTAVGRFCRLLSRYGLLDRTEIAAPDDQSRRQQLLRFRESIPARVNQLVGQARRERDPRIEKTAADMIVPFERFAELMEIYRRGFESRGLEFAVWGHISDGNVHPNVIPRSYDDVLRGRAAILEFGQQVVRLGGCPLAEHGVGRNPVKQALLRQLYGEAGIEAMRSVKRSLDPGWRLAPGVIFHP